MANDERKTSLDDLIPLLDDNDFTLDMNTSEVNKDDLKSKKTKSKSKDEDLEILENDDLDDVILDDDEDDEPKSKIKPHKAEQIDDERDEDNDSQEYLESTVKVLLDKGILFTDKIESWEQLDEELSGLPERVMDSVINGAPTIAQKLLHFAYSAGSNLTERELVDFFSEYSAELKYEPQEIESLEDARSYLTKQYSKQGINKVAIPAMLDALEDELDNGAALMQEAKSIQSKEAAKPKATDKKIAAKKEMSYAEKAKQKKFIKDVSSELEATGWKPSRMDKVNRALTNGSVKQVLSLAGQSPKGLIQLANFTTYFDKETGEFDFEAFIDQLDSKQATKLKKTIAEQAFSSSRTSSSKNPKRKRGGSSLVPIDY